MPSSNNSNRGTDPLTGPQQYVQENRDELLELIMHGDPFIRTLGLAILYKGGQKADIDTVIRELEMLKKMENDELPSQLKR